jgi:hypothetical protein
VNKNFIDKKEKNNEDRKNKDSDAISHIGNETDFNYITNILNQYTEIINSK